MTALPRENREHDVSAEGYYPADERCLLYCCVRCTVSWSSAAWFFEVSRPLAEPTLRPTMSAKDEMTPARSRAPREVSASAASSRPGWEEYMATSQHT